MHHHPNKNQKWVFVLKNQKDEVNILDFKHENQRIEGVGGDFYQSFQEYKKD
jgi:hypothetical protein